MTIREFGRSVLSPYLSYVGFFLGIGLVSGSVVHFPGDPARYAVIGTVGILLFVASSLVDEVLIKKRRLHDDGLIRVILSSVVLSVGIGMVSGSIQHFSDTPKYAATLIPVGIAVSLLGFLLKTQAAWSRALVVHVLGLLLVICLPLGIGLRMLATEGALPHAHADDHRH